MAKNPHLMRYRVWHGEKQANGQCIDKQMEIVTAYSGDIARQMVREMYPEHAVKKAILADVRKRDKIF